MTRTHALIAALGALTLAGCSTLSGPPTASAEVQAASADVSAIPDETRDILSNGYAQMYGAVSSLVWTDDIFRIKFETDEVEAFGKKLASESDRMKSNLEDITKQSPWINLEEDGLPEIENMKLSAVRADRLKSFAPLFGRTQANFERTLLLSNSGALNQMQHLAEVMLELETNPDRIEFLTEAQATFSGLYEDDIRLLNTAYFCDNTAEESVDMR